MTIEFSEAEVKEIIQVPHNHRECWWDEEKDTCQQEELADRIAVDKLGIGTGTL